MPQPITHRNGTSTLYSERILFPTRRCKLILNKEGYTGFGDHLYQWPYGDTPATGSVLTNDGNDVLSWGAMNAYWARDDFYGSLTPAEEDDWILLGDAGIYGWLNSSSVYMALSGTDSLLLSADDDVIVSNDMIIRGNSVTIGDSTENVLGFTFKSQDATGILVWDGPNDRFYSYDDLTLAGDIRQTGSGRREWYKHYLNQMARYKGSSSDPASYAYTANDGYIYTLTEVAELPGIELVAIFSSVTAFNWVKILAAYDGSAAHAIAVQLYNWSTGSYDNFNSIYSAESYSGTVFQNKDFTVPSDTNYVSTIGQVNVRFYLPASGDVSHTLYIDEVGVYQ